MAGPGQNNRQTSSPPCTKWLTNLLWQL